MTNVYFFSAELKAIGIFLGVSVHWLVIFYSLYGFVRQESRIN